MQIQAYDRDTAFSDLKPEWNALLQNSSANCIFSTWEWQSNWWSAYEAGELWVVTCRLENGELVAIAPWFVETQETGERVVRSVGCVDVTDYVDLIILPEYADEVYAALAQHLFEHRDRYDRINLCNIPEKSPTHKQFSAKLKDCGFEVEVELQEVCPVITLPDDWDEYLARLDKKQRHEIRRKLRRAGGDDARWYIVNGEHNLAEELDRFLELMASSQQQKAEFLEDPKNVTFFKKIVPATFEQGWLQLNFLTVDGVPSATYLNFDYNDSIQVYNSGLDPEKFAHLSPGIVLLAYNIQHAIETGHRLFDFLRGNETYKYRMGGEDTRVFKLKAQFSES